MLRIVKTCQNEFEAELVKGLLADIGVECILQGKNMSQIYGGINAMSVNVLVNERDYDRALALISDTKQ
ncbi:MAG: DUF2007 domain-containing protein [Bacteroidaceae bacterium]|nr:DUF2007 domain-containing protein [Prevotellaceae bacterium]MDY5632453.1 DUF2007 domain-containing protein [Bacteroidaceae bacterium]